MILFLLLSENSENKTKTKLNEKTILNEIENSIEDSFAYKNIIKDSDNSFSFLADLKSETFQIELLNDDESIHSSFIMSKLNFHFDCLIETQFKIETLKGIAYVKVFPSLGEKM